MANGLSYQKCGRGIAALPRCVQQKIEELKKGSRINSQASVYEYRYKGKTVYAFNAGCCDQYNAIVDTACNYLCAPSGGITGKGDGKCADFKTEAKEVKLVWSSRQ